MKSLMCFLLVVSLLLIGCNGPTAEEKQVILKLNKNYPQYVFSTGDDYLGVKLKMNLKESKWDSLELKTVYDSSINIYKGSKGIPWVYLLIYDQSDDYLFTISKDYSSGNYTFFKEKVK